jgi:hypothetical protein
MKSTSWQQKRRPCVCVCGVSVFALFIRSVAGFQFALINSFVRHILHQLRDPHAWDGRADESPHDTLPTPYKKRKYNS